MRERPCGHKQIIDELEKELDKLSADIGKIRDKIDEKSGKRKDQELSSIKGKIAQAENELKKLKKKSNFSEQNM